MPLIWLPFMIWFFVDPIWWKHAARCMWIGNTIFGLVFIWLYLYSFSRPEPSAALRHRRHDRDGGDR